MRLAVGTAATAVAMLPFLRPGGPANVGPIDVFMALALLSSLLWFGSSVARLRAPYALATAIFIAGGAAGALAGPVPGSGLIALGQDLWLLAWAVCLANVCRTAHALRVVLHAWAYSSIAWAALLLGAEITGNAFLAGKQSNEGGRTSLLFGDPNYAAHYFFLSMMIIAATRCPGPRAARVGAYALLLPAWALSGSNSGIIELVLGFTIIAIVAVDRSAGLVAAIATCCLLLSSGVVLAPRVPLAHIQQSAHDSEFRLFRDWVGRSERTAGQRTLLFHETVGLYYDGGLLGQGPTSTIGRLKRSEAPFAREAHDDYLAALVERGFLGAIGLLLLIASISARGWSVVRGGLSDAFAEVVPYTAPLLAAIAGTFAVGTVYEVLHIRHVWALFGIVAALQLWGRR
jgi:hypothetical protein